MKVRSIGFRSLVSFPLSPSLSSLLLSLTPLPLSIAFPPPLQHPYPPAPPLLPSLSLPLLLRLLLPPPLSPLPSSQDCFKASWSEHKALHRVTIASAGDGSVAVTGGAAAAAAAAASPSAAAIAAGSSELTVSQQFLQQGWMFVLRKGQSRSPVMPNFEWTGYVGGHYCMQAHVFVPK